MAHLTPKVEAVLVDATLPEPPSLQNTLYRLEGMPWDKTTKALVRRTVEQWFQAQAAGDCPAFRLRWDRRMVTVEFDPEPPELPMDAAEYERRTGQVPEHDDLDRVNCDKVGKIAHWNCGWCWEHDGPKFQCMCAMEGR